jgi:hypothetical protein
MERPMTPNDKVSDLLANFPGPVTLFPSRKKWVLVFLVGALFAVGGILMIRDGDSSGWFVAGFFGVVAVTSLAVMLPGAGDLTLDRDGFAAKSLFRGYRTRWVDTQGFESSAIPPSHQRLVVYDDLTQTPRTLTRINVSITGRNAALGDTYGLSADDLARLMTAWRERALGANGRLSAGGASRQR